MKYSIHSRCCYFSIKILATFKCFDSEKKHGARNSHNLSSAHPACFILMRAQECEFKGPHCARKMENSGIKQG